MDDREVRRRVAAVEEGLAAVEALDEPARGLALGLVQDLVDLYGESLARLLGHARELEAGAETSNGDGGRLNRAVAGDELLAHLLLLHDLHPDDATTRAEAALEAMRPQLVSRDASVTLAGIEAGSEGGVAQLLFDAVKPLPEKLTELFEEAVLAAAPELERVESGGAVTQRGFVSLGSLRREGGTA